MLAFGLAGRMAGISGIGAEDAATLDRYGTAWRKIPRLSEQYFTRTERLVGRMKRRVGTATRAHRHEPVSVFVYDSGRATPVTAAGTAVLTDIIARAGGRNILAGLRKSWTTVSWEQVVTRRPELIVIVDYGDVSAEQKRHFLETNPATRDLPAVRNGNIVVLPYADVTPGPGNVRAVEELVRAFAGR